MIDEYDHITAATNEIDYLNEHRVEVGIIGEDGMLQMIAIVNNDGTTIRAKKSKYLTIPVKQADGTISFIRKESVTIPARKFLERTIWNFERKRQEYAEEQLVRLVNGETSGRAIMEGLGRLTVTNMRKAVHDFKTPKNAPLTIQNKGKDDPLIDTGALINAISYRITAAY